MLFRGTSRYASLQIDQLFDAMGAGLNAGTGKETTSVYARVLDIHLAEAFDVMADMVWRPGSTRASSSRSARSCSRRSPCTRTTRRTRCSTSSARRSSAPTRSGARSSAARRSSPPRSPPALRTFHGAQYVPANVVVAAAGSVDHDALVELVRRTGVERPGQAPPALPGPPPSEPARMRFVAKETEQYHLCLGAPGIPRDDDRRFALRVLDNILGGTSSSRLFQEVREKRGLAYSVYSFQSTYAGTGQVGLYLGTRPDNVVRAMKVVADELERLREDPATADELARSRRTSRAAWCCRSSRPPRV